MEAERRHCQSLRHLLRQQQRWLPPQLLPPQARATPPAIILSELSRRALGGSVGVVVPDGEVGLLCSVARYKYHGWGLLLSVEIGRFVSGRMPHAGPGHRESHKQGLAASSSRRLLAAGFGLGGTEMPDADMLPGLHPGGLTGGLEGFRTGRRFQAFLNYHRWLACRMVIPTTSSPS